MNKTIVLITVILWAATLGCATSKTATSQTSFQKKVNIKELWSSPSAFRQPESICYDAAKDHFYVSNINGEPLERNGNGFISILSANGTIDNLQWVNGLNAPKGLALVNGILYVSDIDSLVAIDTETGKIVDTYTAEDAQFLNDVAVAPDGAILVSDMMGGAIYRYFDNKIELWLNSPEVGNPNGLTVTSGTLVVADWGSMDEKTDRKGRLLFIDINNKQILKKSQPLGHLDGLESDKKNGFWITDWLTGNLMKTDPDGNLISTWEYGQGTADIAFLPEKKAIYIPLMNENRILALSIAGE